MASAVCGGCGSTVRECRASRPRGLDLRAVLEEIYRSRSAAPEVEAYLLAHGLVRRVVDGELAGLLVRTDAGDQAWARQYNQYLRAHPSERARVRAAARD